MCCGVLLAFIVGEQGNPYFLFSYKEVAEVSLMKEYANLEDGYALGLWLGPAIRP